MRFFIGSCYYIPDSETKRKCHKRKKAEPRIEEKRIGTADKRRCTQMKEVKTGYPQI
jgi:hypothetical protein